MKRTSKQAGRQAGNQVDEGVADFQTTSLAKVNEQVVCHLCCCYYASQRSSFFVFFFFCFSFFLKISSNLTYLSKIGESATSVKSCYLCKNSSWLLMNATKR